MRSIVRVQSISPRPQFNNFSCDTVPLMPQTMMFGKLWRTTKITKCCFRPNRNATQLWVTLLPTAHSAQGCHLINCETISWFYESSFYCLINPVVWCTYMHINELVVNKNIYYYYSMMPYPDALGWEAGGWEGSTAVHLCPRVRHLYDHLNKWILLKNSQLFYLTEVEVESCQPLIWSKEPHKVP